MANNTREITSKQQPLLTMTVTPGHFATRHSHINYYVDLTAVKNQQTAAKLAGEELAREFASVHPLESIICLDGTEIVAAFLANALSDSGNETIAILTPEINSSGQFMFRENTRPMVSGKNIMLLVANTTTGSTVTQAVNCINYYHGRIIAVSALFSAINEINGVPVTSIFSIDELPDYSTYEPNECPMCDNHEKIDALVNSFGYSCL